MNMHKVMVHLAGLSFNVLMLLTGRPMGSTATTIPKKFTFGNLLLETGLIWSSKKSKALPSHKAHMALLISVSLALSQTPAYTARPRIPG